MPTTVCLDTSFLMLSAKFHTDVLGETERVLGRRVRFAVPEAVVTELKELSTHSGATGRDARVALVVVQQKRIQLVSSRERKRADETLMEISRLPDTIVATADMKLRKRIRSIQKPVIFFREKAKFELEGIEAAYW